MNALFATDTGLLGIAPQSISEGDEVSIWLGANSPFIMRSLPDLGNTYYELVGPSYVSGFMAGEIVDKLYMKGLMSAQMIYVR